VIRRGGGGGTRIFLSVCRSNFAILPAVQVYRFYEIFQEIVNSPVYPYLGLSVHVCMSACMHVFETIHLCMHMLMTLYVYVYMCIWKPVCVYVCTLVCLRTSMCGRLSGINYASKDGLFYFDLYVVMGRSSVLSK
jgi:hypothetical protein